MPRRRKFSPLKMRIRPETIHSAIGIILVSLGILFILSFSGQGILLTRLNEYLAYKLGASLLILPFILIAAGMMLFRTRWAWSRPNVLLGSILLLLGSLGLFKTGEIGQNLFNNISPLISTPGTYVTFGSVFLIGALVTSQFSVAEVLEGLAAIRIPGKKKDADGVDSDFSSSRFRLPKLSLPFGQAKAQSFSINKGMELGDEDDTPGKAIDDMDENKKSDSDKSDEILTGNILTPNPAHLIWEYPPLSLLSASEGGEAERGNVKENAGIIEETLQSFGIQASVSEVNYGPSVTQYGLEITRGTKLSKITGLSTDLALALAAPTGQIRIEAPIAGRSLVGVEVPNKSAQYVTLRKMLSSPDMKKHPSKLATALGINVSGNPVVMDIAKMPHILIAGATGSGKSVSINTFICSILFRASPAEVKLILVDPKRVELTGYNGIPHLLVPVIVEPKEVVSALNWATHEMEKRYKQLAEVGVRHIEGYNELAGHAAMPNIVIVIDELADIMLYAPNEVEESVTRIAQMARAVGIHLVLATQRPSVDVITGLIKANIPGRIAFNVASMTDSRVVLDTPGAEKLLGKGDMLFIPPDQAKPSRIQGTFVSDQEIRSLIDFIKSQGQKPEYEEEIVTKYKSTSIGKNAASAGATGEERDELFDEVVRYVAQMGKGSSSLIQRKFSVGYNRAARILDQLYTAGIVGPQEGSKPREVNTTKAMEYLRSLEIGG